MNTKLNSHKVQLHNNHTHLCFSMPFCDNNLTKKKQNTIKSAQGHSQKSLLKKMENRPTKKKKKSCLQKWGWGGHNILLRCCGPCIPNLILTRVHFSTLQTNMATLGWCSMLMVWLVLGLSLGVAIYLAPLSLWSYALLTQALFVTNSNIKTAITTKIYHLDWPARS